MYEIRVDRRSRLVEVALEGMLSTGEVSDYIVDLKRSIVANRLKAYAMVIDVSRCLIQSQDVIRAMGTHMATMPKATSLAVVTGSSLARMQVRRLFTQPYARIVGDVATARAWVCHGIEPEETHLAIGTS